MNNPYLEIIIIFFLLVLNGVFAMSEIALVASRKTRLQQLVDEDHPRAKVILELANNPTDFLSMIQVGITLIGILAGAFGGATIARQLEGLIQTLPILGPYSQAISVAVVVLTITYFSFFYRTFAKERRSSLLIHNL